MRTLSLSTAILSSLVLGLLLGTGLNIINPGLADLISVWIKPVGSLWINSIRMTVIPLLMSLLLTAIASNGGGSSTAKLGLKTLGLFVLFVAASCLCRWREPHIPLAAPRASIWEERA